MLYTYMINQQTHIYKYVLSDTVILHQHILVTVLTTISVAYNKNTNNMQKIVQKCLMLQLICKSHVTPSGCIIYFCTLICILIVFLS